MKKLIKISTIFMFMLFASAIAMAQDVVPPDSLDVDVSDVFSTFVALVSTIPLITGAVLKAVGKSKDTPNWIVQAISWGTGVAVTLIGWALDLGFLSEMSWIHATFYGLGASLAANGVADTKIIQGVLPGILKLFRKKV